MKTNRPEISETTTSIGVGSLTLDVKDLRVTGHRWTEQEINDCWIAISTVYRAFSRPVMLRNGHLYLVDNPQLEDPIYIGAGDDHPALKASTVRKLREQGMRTIAEVLEGTVLPLEGGRGFRDVILAALPPHVREHAITARRVGQPDRRAKPRRVSDRSRLATGKRHKR